MLGGVLTVGGNLRGRDILRQIFLDICVDMCHKIKHVRAALVGCAQQPEIDKMGVDQYQL